MAAFVKYYAFVENLAEKVNNLGSDTLTIVLSNTAPDLTDTNLVSLSEITAGNGYTAGGNAVTITASSQTTGTYTLVGNDLVITATGGTIGPFRYAILHNSTANAAIGYWDYGSSITLQDGETFTVNFGASILSLV